VIALHPVEPDPQTFEDLYVRHHRDVLRYAAFLVRDPDDGADVTAETFARAFDAWRAGRIPADRSLPWLLLVARRIVIDRSRRRKLLRWVPFHVAETERETDAKSDGLARRDFWLWMDRLAAALPDRQREVVYLRYRRDLTDEEIGQILGLSPSGVRSLAARAIRRLREHPELLS
jgi:RNA polymerase sigma factor (sigma-70 family)